MASIRGVDLQAWWFVAADYFKNCAGFLDEAADLIDTLRLPPIYSRFFLNDVGVDRPETQHNTWLTLQDMTYDAIKRDVIAVARKSNILCERASLGGKHSDMWLRDFAENCPPSLTETRARKMARDDMIEHLVGEIMDFNEEIAPAAILPTRDSMLVVRAGEKVLDRSLLEHCSVHNAGLMAVEVLYAMRKHKAQDIKAAFHVWADGLTQEAYECFVARRIPQYLSLGVQGRQPA